MRRLAVTLLGALAALGATASTAGSAPAPRSAGSTVRVGDNWFVRKGGGTVTVAKGTRVTWRFTGRRRHDVNVTSGPRRFTSPAKRSGTFSKTLSRKGTYSIVCDFHRGMTMRLKVR